MRPPPAAARQHTPREHTCECDPVVVVYPHLCGGRDAVLRISRRRSPPDGGGGGGALTNTRRGGCNWLSVGRDHENPSGKAEKKELGVAGQGGGGWGRGQGRGGVGGGQGGDETSAKKGSRNAAALRQADTRRRGGCAEMRRRPPYPLGEQTRQTAYIVNILMGDR